jgi:pimeloyl-ACP methyl ester carboxylesterase
MSTMTYDSVTIRYEVRGDGPPLLALAPGGLRASRAESWQAAPIDPLAALSDGFRVVAMDQRNTGTSVAPVTAEDGWGSYARDQLALMDELGVDRFAVIGMCIGGAFIARLLADAPGRVTAAVALQPIGLDGNRESFRGMFDAWRAGIADEHPEADEATWERVWSNLFGSDRPLFSADESALRQVDVPVLVCQGADEYHPTSASRLFAGAVPRSEYVERWKEGDDRDAALGTVRRFLETHADA